MVAVRVFSELAEYPGAEDHTESWQGTNDDGVRVLFKMVGQLGLEVYDPVLEHPLPLVQLPLHAAISPLSRRGEDLYHEVGSAPDRRVSDDISAGGRHEDDVGLHAFTGRREFDADRRVNHNPVTRLFEKPQELLLQLLRDPLIPD